MVRCLILSYEENRKMAEELEYNLNRLNYPNVEIVFSENLSGSGLMPSKFVYILFQKYILPKMLQYDDDILFFEDDAVILQSYEIIRHCIYKSPMNRIAWWAEENIKREGFKLIVGCTIISFQKSFIRTLADTMKTTQPQHFDRFLSKYFQKDVEWTAEEGGGYGGTKGHYSSILGGYRHGQWGKLS